MKLATVEVLAAALRPELEKNSSVEGSGGLALALGGAIGGGAQGGVAGVLKSCGKATEKTNFGGGWWWSAVRFEERRRKFRSSEALSTRWSSG